VTFQKFTFPNSFNLTNSYFVGKNLPKKRKDKIENVFSEK